MDAVASIDSAITVYMRLNSLNQAQMAEKLGMNVRTLCLKRRGEAEWKLSELEAIRDITGKSIGALMGELLTA